MFKPINSIVIVGGGSAGWMSAAFLSRVLSDTVCITLVESDSIGTVGVGEATIPPIKQFNAILGIDEHAFLAATNGTYKLGIQFENWGKQGDSYMHAFGPIGRNLNSIDFLHYFLCAKEQGDSSAFWDYSINYQAAKRGRYYPLHTLPNSNAPGIECAYHFDAGLYAQLLRRYSQQNGVTRIEGKIVDVKQCVQSGHIESLRLEQGGEVSGDFFIDCSGFRGLLIEQCLNTGYEDWTHYLPCDSAVALQSSSPSLPVPYTRAIAHIAGWQWQIPLQNRVGNGMVYCSDYLGDDQALEQLRALLPGKALSEPNFIRFTTGRRKRQWNKNVLSIGLSSGFLEPLESTSLHLVQSALLRFFKLFPAHTGDYAVQDEYNTQSQQEFEQIRDFLILHYAMNQKADNGFWRDCQSLPLPASLKQKITLFSETGRVFRFQDELFTESAWQQVMLGQNTRPDHYHPLAKRLPKDKLSDFLQSLRVLTTGCVDQMPTHSDYLSQFCSSEKGK